MMKKRHAHLESGFLKRALQKDEPSVRLLMECQERYAADSAEMQSQIEAASCKERLAEKDRLVQDMAAECQRQQEAAGYQQKLADCQCTLEQLKTALRREKKAHRPKAGQEDRLSGIPDGTPKKKPSGGNPRCNICGSPMQFSFTNRVLGKYDASYFYCGQCEHIQTEEPYWLEEAFHPLVADSDTGEVLRNEQSRELVCAAAQRLFQPLLSMLEYAGGHGLLPRMLRDAGIDCYWHDKYSANVFARHYEDDGQKRHGLVLAFEALEHSEQPLQELERIFSRGESLLFGEELLAEPCPKDWWTLCSEQGHNIHFYSMKTFQTIADIFHKKLYFHKNIGLLRPKKSAKTHFRRCFSTFQRMLGASGMPAIPRRGADMNAVINENQP